MDRMSDDGGLSLADLDRLLADIVLGASGDDAQLQALFKALTELAGAPFQGFVINEPVSVVSFEYAGNVRRGVTARCRDTDGSDHVVSAADVVPAPRSPGARYLAAYRRWLGLDPFAAGAPAAARRARGRNAAPTGPDLSGPVELVVLSTRKNAARCRPIGKSGVLTLRTGSIWDIHPGEILMVTPDKQWRYAGHPYLSGKVESIRLDVAALDLVPLKLEDCGVWSPEDHYWGEVNEPIEDWAKPIIAHGPRPQFEMEQVLPGADPEDFEDDPIRESVELKEAGDHAAALKILMGLCEADLRCLDAHAHLGNLLFDHVPSAAIRHYEVGVRIGELSFARDFEGLLPWGLVDNRPFLRCMHSFGLCLWRLGRFEEAGLVFDRMLWLNPTDNQGIRFLVGEVREKAPWEDHLEL